MRELNLFNEVATAYADSISQDGYKLRNLNFEASIFLPIHNRVLQAALVVIGRYNDFDAFTVIDILSALDPECEVKIAREGSVCLYVQFKQDMSDSKRNYLAMKNLLADEIDEIEKNLYRIWWD